MSSNSFKNIQNGINKLRNKLIPNEPDRRKDAIEYLLILEQLVRDSYHEMSTSDYMFLKTLTDSTKEAKYFGGFTKNAKERLLIIEKRYNYIHEQKNPDVE
tara:strand:+ start:300 stop:602 length:303 start_codon:yes stop_codon:yes gene_type:complete